MTPFKVILNELDPARKLQVVSELARAFGLDEQVASDIASNVPIIIIDDIAPGAVGTIRERLASLAAAGAKLTTADYAPEDIPRVNWPEPPDIARVDEPSMPVREPDQPVPVRMRVEDQLAVFSCPDCGARFEVGRAHGPAAQGEELSSYETLADESLPLSDSSLDDHEPGLEGSSDAVEPLERQDEAEVQPAGVSDSTAESLPLLTPTDSMAESLPLLTPTESTDSWLNPPLALDPASSQASGAAFSALKPLDDGPLERGRREPADATDSDARGPSGMPRAQAVPVELKPEDPISVLDTVPEMNIPESMTPPASKRKAKRKVVSKSQQKVSPPPPFPEPLTPGSPSSPSELANLQPASETEELPMLTAPDSGHGRSVVKPKAGAGNDLDNLYGMFEAGDVESDSGGNAKPPAPAPRRINTPANLSSDDFTEVAPIDFADIDKDLADLQSDDELLKSSALNPPDDKSDLFEPLDPDEAREIMQGGGNDALQPPPPSPTRPESGELEPLDPNESLELLNSGRHSKVDAGGSKRGRKKRSSKKDGGGKLIPLSASDENFDFLETRDPDKPDDPSEASSRGQKNEEPDPFARAKRRTDPFVKARREKEEKERKTRSKVSARTKAKTKVKDPGTEKSKRSDRKTRGSSRKTKERASASARTEAPPEKAAAGGDDGDIYGLVLSRIPTDAKRQKAADLISEIQGIGRRDALKLTDRTIIPVLKGVTKDRAEKHHKKFKKAGISARVTTRRIR